MNYRHHYHAGNFADVFKHVLLLDLVRHMQKKEAGFLYIDTHAGRGRYDLHLASQGDSLARQPEHPNGIGRLLSRTLSQPALVQYRDAIRAFDDRFNAAPKASDIGFYPGSPWLVREALRPQDRMHLCEKHPEEFDLLDIEFGRAERTSLHPNDGYNALRAALPPRERRALVLIDPPFEDQAEYTRIIRSIEDGLRRMPAAVIAIWYPLASRAGIDEFCEELRLLDLPPTLQVQLSIAGEFTQLRMRGCGLIVLNPPWKAEENWRALLAELTPLLAQEPRASFNLRWLAPESPN